ncbi:MAG: SusD/RagB family nutrient-binding outer membrane lipoprotein [Bacteroidota bacterium]
MKKITIVILGLVLLPWFHSCSNFEELNTDPNQTSSVTAEMLATNLILGTTRYPGVGKDFLYKDMLAKYISYMEGATGYQYNEFDRTYFGSMLKLKNVDKMIEAASGTTFESAYRGLGHFVRAYTFFNLTMAVGDIPYSEAIMGEDGILNPKYDTQKDVFLGILRELEQADSLFAVARDFTGDMIYQGKVAQWQKASNNLELKVLTHLYKKTADTDLKVVERFNEIVTGKALMTSSSDNFQLVYSDVQVEYYPFFNSNFRKYPIMSTTIVDKMKELNDYRLFYFAAPALAEVAAGKLGNDWDAYVGVDPSDDFSSISARYAANQVSGINARYYALEQGEPTFLLSYAEQCFMIAEGIVRGWVTGDAKSYYDDGVTAALQFVADFTPDDSLYHHDMKIDATVISNYLAGSDVAFNGSDEEKLQKIWQQRYLMGFMQDGWNSYYEYRRVGYPEFPINELTNLNPDKTKLPVRWMYPDKELANNREQVEEAINRQFGGNDAVTELMWILE